MLISIFLFKKTLKKKKQVDYDDKSAYSSNINSKNTRGGKTAAGGRFMTKKQIQ